MLNLSIESDFQNVAQEDPQLISYIREHHLRPPPPRSHVKHDTVHVEAIPEIGELFGWKVSSINKIIFNCGILISFLLLLFFLIFCQHKIFCFIFWQ